MDENQNAETRETKDFFTGVVIGSVVGSLAALLFTTKSGKDFLTKLQSKAQFALDKTSQVKNIVIEKGNDALGLAGEAKEKLSKVVQDQKNTQVDTAHPETKKTDEDKAEVLKNAKNTIEKLSNEIEEKIDSLKK